MLEYIGNIGRAHSVTFLKYFEMKFCKDFRLILSVYDYYANYILQHVEATNSKDIIIVPFLEKRHLRFI